MMMIRPLKYLPLLLLVAACAQNPFGNKTPEGEFRSASTGQQTPATEVGPAPNSAAFFSQSVGDRVLFEVDQYTLSEAGKATLDRQAGWLLANTGFQITVEGHADEQGTREYNLALGARRARSVQEYFLSRGVDASRMRTLSYGKERPLAICSEESCYAQNRRAVTVLAGGVS